MKWSAKLGTFRGIALYVHWTFLILLAWVGVVFVSILVHELGHALMGEQDARISLLQRLVEHASNTARYSIYYGAGRDAYDLRGRTAHETIFNPSSGTFRCPNSQQGYSPFSTWTRGLAWGICGFAEQLEFLETLASGSLPERDISVSLETQGTSTKVEVKERPVAGITDFGDDAEPDLRSRERAWADRVGLVDEGDLLPAVAPAGGLEGVIRRAAQTIGLLTGELGVAIAPRLDQAVLEQLEMVIVSSDKVLLVLTLANGGVRTVYVDLPARLAAEPLAALTSILNERLAGLTLHDIRASLPDRLRDAVDDRQSGELLNVFMQSAGELVADELSSDEVLLGRTSVLANQPEFANGTNLKSLIELTEAGRKPVQLGNGETRGFLEDGDTIILRARAERHRRHGLRPTDAEDPVDPREPGRSEDNRAVFPERRRHADLFHAGDLRRDRILQHRRRIDRLAAGDIDSDAFQGCDSLAEAQAKRIPIFPACL